MAHVYAITTFCLVLSSALNFIEGDDYLSNTRASGPFEPRIDMSIMNPKLLGTAAVNGEIFILTPDWVKSHGVAYIGWTPTEMLGLGNGANADVTFTTKIGGEVLGSWVNKLPSGQLDEEGSESEQSDADDQTKALLQLRKATWEEMDVHRKLTPCKGRGFGVQLGQQFDCLIGGSGFQACQDPGFFLVTADDDLYDPGIYSVSNGEVEDFSPSLELFDSKITQVKVSLRESKAGPEWTMAQLYIDDRAVLDPLFFRSPGPVGNSSSLIFSAHTDSACSQEHLLANIRVTSDAEISPADYEILCAYLENPRVFEDLLAMDKQADAAALFEAKYGGGESSEDSTTPVPDALFHSAHFFFLGLFLGTMLFASMALVACRSFAALKEELTEKPQDRINTFKLVHTESFQVIDEDI